MVSTTQEGVSSPDSVPGEGACSGKCAAVKDTDADAMSPSDGDNIEDVQSALEDARRRAMEDDPDFMRKSLATLNAEAVELYKKGDLVGCLAAYGKLCAKVGAMNLTHPTLHVSYNNMAAASMRLGLHDEALKHATRAAQLAEGNLLVDKQAVASLVKALCRKGDAFAAMDMHRQASAAFTEALKIDPFHLDSRRGLEISTQKTLADVLSGEDREQMLLEAPPPVQRITYHPHAAPLHQIRTGDVLPTRLLTPFQAESELDIKDAYMYVTVMADVDMPRRYLDGYLEDVAAHARYRQAIHAAVQAIESRDMDCRVLNVGAGGGMHALMALEAGARHVTCTERWLYLATSCKEVLKANGIADERFKVVYKRPTDLALRGDVPGPCNVLIMDMVESGLLMSGAVPAARHVRSFLIDDDPVCIPASVTVYAQMVEVKTPSPAGVRMDAVDAHRWLPSHVSHKPLSRDAWRPLADPVQVWTFSLLDPPQSSETREVDLTVTADRNANAVLFWLDMHLYGDVHVVTGPEHRGWLGPALQHLPGEARVHLGEVLPLRCSHNTVRMRFDLDSADFIRACKAIYTFPEALLARVRDAGLTEAYERAIERAIKRLKPETGPVESTSHQAHVLDLGCGSGALSVLAARHGADSVVAVDINESCANLTRRVAAQNGVLTKVTALHKDAGLLERGEDTRVHGVNLVILDSFDHSLLGASAVPILEAARRKVVQPGATVIPKRAAVYCMGIEMLTGRVAGFDFSQMDKYRFGAQGYPMDLAAHAGHWRPLTRPCRVADISFEDGGAGKGRQTAVRLDVVADGILNAVVTWFDLYLDEETVVSSATEGFLSLAGVDLEECRGGELGAVDEAEEGSGAVGGATAGGDVRGVGSGDGVGVAAGGAGTVARKDSPDGAATLVFDPSPAFAGARPGMVFQMGPLGLGYYPDAMTRVRLDDEVDWGEGGGEGCKDGDAADPAGPVEEVTAESIAEESPSDGGKAGAPAEAVAVGDGSHGAEEVAAEGTVEEESEVQECESKALVPQGGAEVDGPNLAPDVMGQAGSHWGQCLNSLDRIVRVRAGRKVTLIVKRDDVKIGFSLRQGVGVACPRAPWLEEWGGGSSIENPHVQRVQYCELLLKEFVQRCRGDRFPPIEKDMQASVGEMWRATPHAGPPRSSAHLTPGSLVRRCTSTHLLRRTCSDPVSAGPASADAAGALRLSVPGPQVTPRDGPPFGHGRDASEGTRALRRRGRGRRNAPRALPRLRQAQRGQLLEGRARISAWRAAMRAGASRRRR